MTAPLLISLASGLPPAVADNLGYFLKDINTPGWHWLFRLIFGLGLAVALAVYGYYRAREKRGSQAKGRKGTGFSE